MQSTSKPVNTSRWWSYDKVANVEKFVATAIKVPLEFNPTNPTQQLVHWRGACAYSYISDTTVRWRSTSFDTQKLSKTDPVIEVQLISKNFDVSSTAVGYWESPLVKTPCTATDVHKLLVAKGLDRYRYNGSGSGCQTWTRMLIRLLEEEGILPIGSEAKFLAKVEEVRSDPSCWVPDESGAIFI